jgi:hypothetical protein
VLTKEGVLCDPFITESMLCNVYDYNHLVTAARIIGAVTKVAKKLVVYYNQLDGRQFSVIFFNCCILIIFFDNFRLLF